MEHAVPNGPILDSDGLVAWSDLAEVLDVGDDGVGTVLYNVLDHRIAAQRFMGPYSHLGVDPLTPAASLEGADLRTHEPLSIARLMEIGSESLSGAASPLRSQFGLVPSDVSAALALTRQVHETANGERSYAVVAEASGGPTLLYARISADGLSSPRQLSSALQRVQVGAFSSVDLFRHGMRPTSVNGTAATTELYEPSIGLAADRFDGFGAAQILHQIRVHLLRASNVDGFLGNALAEVALEAPLAAR